MEAIRSPETSILSGATWRNFPEDGILKSQKSLHGPEIRALNEEEG
jgi:hypothetical protein